MEGKAPPNWNGAGGGTVTVVEEGADTVLVRVAAGQHELQPGAPPLTLRFSLLITPVNDPNPNTNPTLAPTPTPTLTLTLTLTR